MPAHVLPKYLAAIIVMTLVVFLSNAGAFFFVVYRASLEPTVTITGATSPSKSAVCPGETLDYQFTLNINKPGTVDVSTSFHPAESLRPSYVRLQQFIFTGPTSFVLIRHAVIPSTYADPSSGTEQAWQVGAYAQRTIVNIEGHSNGAAVIEIPFTIRANCQ